LGGGVGGSPPLAEKLGFKKKKKKKKRVVPEPGMYLTTQGGGCENRGPGWVEEGEQSWGTAERGKTNKLQNACPCVFVVGGEKSGSKKKK